MSGICEIDCDAPALETRLRQAIEQIGGCFAINYSSIDGECFSFCEGINSIESVLSKITLTDFINLNEVEEGDDLDCSGINLSELVAGSVSKEDDCYGINAVFVDAECVNNCDDILPLREKILRSFTKISDTCYGVFVSEMDGATELACDAHTTETLAGLMLAPITGGHYAWLVKKKE